MTDNNLISQRKISFSRAGGSPSLETDIQIPENCKTFGWAFSVSGAFAAGTNNLSLWHFHNDATVGNENVNVGTVFNSGAIGGNSGQNNANGANVLRWTVLASGAGANDFVLTLKFWAN